MRVSFEGTTEEGGIREHPWTVSELDPRAQYYNLREHPELISEVLEDFKSYEQHEAIQWFYEILRWINGPDSKLESSDCRFTSPRENVQRDKFSWQLVCAGRLMFFFREITRNLSKIDPNWVSLRRADNRIPLYTPNEAVVWLGETSKAVLESLYTDVWWPVIQIHLFPVFYRNAPGDEADKFGFQVVYEFHTWADNEDDLFSHDLKVIFSAINQCLRFLSSKI